MKIRVNGVRMSFAAIFEPKQVGGQGDPRFSAAFAIEPDSENANKCHDAMVTAAKEKWKDKAAAIFKELKSKGRVCFKTEPLTNAEGEVYDGFEDMYVLNASNKTRPLVLDKNKSPLTAADGRPYSGCYVNAVIDIWAQDNQYGKRLNGTLMGVQFDRDGDAFGGGRPAAPDDFETVEGGEDADDFA
jgi:hypothetical protein